MKIRSNTKGFTLLELLVVVLIIGILAAIALPQYRKAKEKAEATELLTNVKTLKEAQHRFYLLHDTFAESFDDLDIEFRGYEREGCEDFSIFGNKTDCISNEKSVLFISSIGVIFGLHKIGRYKFSGFRGATKTISCYELKKDENKFCSELFKCSFKECSSGEVNCYYSCQF